MDAKTVVEKIASSRVIPQEIKSILYNKAIIEKGSIYRLTGTKFEYMKEFCSYCKFPDTLLQSADKLEELINKLLWSNFEIKEHMTDLFDSCFMDKMNSSEESEISFKETPVH